MIRFRYHQTLKDGTNWVSDIHEYRDSRAVIQGVCAGYLNGQPRSAVDESGATIFALDAKGRVVADYTANYASMNDVRAYKVVRDGVLLASFTTRSGAVAHALSVGGARVEPF